MQKIIYITTILFLFSACKTTEEKEDNALLNVRKEFDEKRWENALVLTNAVVDSLYELYKDKYTIEQLEKYKIDGWRWDGNNFLKVISGMVIGEFLEHKNQNPVDIHPNPTTSSVTVVLFKNMTKYPMTEGKLMSLYDFFNLEQYFPFDVAFKLILEEKTVWTYRNSSCYGTEVIDASVLHKAGNYLLVVEIDGYSASKNFMVLKKQ